MNFDEFSKDVESGGGAYSDWRDKGKLVFWIVPGSTIGKREKIFLPVKAHDDDDKKIIRKVSRAWNGQLTKFRDWLEANKDIDDDDTVLRIKHGRGEEEYCKGELLGLKGYTWKKKLLVPNSEYLFDVVEQESPEEGQKFLVLNKLCGKKLGRQIKISKEELGDEGDPFVIPCAAKVMHLPNKKAANDKYDAMLLSRAKLPEEIEAIFADETPLDCEAEADKIYEDDDFGTAIEILAGMYVCDEAYPFPSADTEDEEPEEKPKTVRKKIRKKKTVTRKKTTKAKQKAARKPDGPVTVKDCEPGVEYVDEDGSVLVFERINEKKTRGVFKDQEDDTVIMAIDDTVDLFENKPETVKGRAETDKQKPDKAKQMQCGECDSWVDNDATDCPTCGVVFESDEKAFD